LLRRDEVGPTCGSTSFSAVAEALQSAQVPQWSGAVAVVRCALLGNRRALAGCARWRIFFALSS